MNSEEFIEAIKLAVVDSAYKGMILNLDKPPGRSPSPLLIEMSECYHKLSTNDKDILQRIIKESIHMSIFGFLCVLDGVRAIEDSPNKGDLLLYYSKGGQRNLLNDQDMEYLHDIFNQQ